MTAPARRVREPRHIVVLNERDLDNPLAGGAEVHVFEIFRRLVERGHAVRLLAASFRGAARTVDMQGIEVRRLGDRYRYYGQVPFALRRMLATRPADVVVDVLNKVPFLTPWVVDVPCCAIVHHLFGATAFRQVAFPFAAVTTFAERLIPLAHRATPMLAISESTRADLVARGIAADHVVVVPPGLDLSAYTPGPANGRGPLVVWIGRLERYKRADVLIDAFVAVRRAVPAARLAIIGSGHERDALEGLARDRGLGDAVQFAGFIPEAEKIAYLQRAALLVNTSEKEGFGLTTIEANACGTPNVSSDVPGLRDSVRDGETGMLVPFGDVDALARAVVDLLTNDPRRARLVEQGFAWAAGFSWERSADAVEDLIERAIALHARRRTIGAAVPA